MLLLLLLSYGYHSSNILCLDKLQLTPFSILRSSNPCTLLHPLKPLYPSLWGWGFGKNPKSLPSPYPHPYPRQNSGGLSNPHQSLLTPTTVKQVWFFLGFRNFYRRFIGHYLEIAQPLNNMTKKDKKWEWTEDCKNTFQKLKEEFLKEPVLLMPDPMKPFVLESDA